MKTKKKGGRLLGKGSYGCVFNIEFPCRGKTRNVSQKNRYISKVFFHTKAVKEATLEFSLNKLVYKIKGNSRWCVLWKRICRPHSYSEIYKIDKQIKECLKTSKLTPDEFNERSAMLIGKYGGKSLENVFSVKMKNINNKETFLKLFLNIMKRMLSLFEGIKSLKSSGLTHSDIKRGNIVLDGKRLKMIDFGLAYKLDNIEEYKKRANRQYYDDRIYTPYPIDYVYTHTSKQQETVDLNAYSKNETKRNFNEYLKIHEVFFKRENIVGKIIDFLKDVKVDKTNILNTIDVYSLGYLIPKSFYSDLDKSGISMEDIKEYIEDPRIRPFIALFKDMTRETFFKEGPRISQEEAYNRFRTLLTGLL